MADSSLQNGKIYAMCSGVRDLKKNGSKKISTDMTGIQKNPAEIYVIVFQWWVLIVLIQGSVRACK